MILSQFTPTNDANDVRNTLNASLTVAGMPVTAFGSVGATDDSPVLQAALDWCETNDQDLNLEGLPINIRGTVYVGSVRIRGRGAVLNITIDTDFVQRGTATERVEGVILTKSSAGAGGPATVAIRFDELRIVATKTSAAKDSTIKTALLIENTSAFVGNRLDVSITAPGGVQSNGTTPVEATAIDFRDGTQGVNIPTIVTKNDNPGGTGGSWIRNRTAARDTAFIEIGSWTATTNTVDEAVSIFNSGVAGADLHDIHLGSITFTNTRGSLGVSVFRNVGGYDATKMLRISIDRIEGTIGNIVGGGAGGFGVKADNTYPTIGSIKLTYNGTWDAAQASIFAVRFVQGIGQTAPLVIGAVELRFDSNNATPSSNAAGLYGYISVGRLVVRGSGSGWKNIGYNVATLNGVDVQTTAYTGEAIYGGDSVSGSIDGPLRDVGQFRGTYTIDAGRWPGAILFRTTASRPYIAGQLLDADIQLFGTGSVSRVTNLDAANVAPGDVRYRATVGANASFASGDTVSANVTLSRFDASRAVGGVVSRVTGPSTLPSGDPFVVLASGATLTIDGSNAVTVNRSLHRISATGTVATINGGVIEGQMLRLFPNSGTTLTVQHAGGGNIRTSTGANIVAANPSWVDLWWSQVSGIWLAKP